MHNNVCFLSLSDEVKERYKLSSYNIYLHESTGIVFNSRSTAIVAFDDFLVTTDLVNDLLELGFLVENGVDEFDIIKTEYTNRYQYADSLHLIIAPTLDCQFRCMYCYEEHPKKYMKETVKSKIISLVKEHASKGYNISIDWYGGEPLLDFDSIICMSQEFQKHCIENNVLYTANMITNGFAFDKTAILKLSETKIESLQITIDGMKEVHERRRRLINEESSFERIVENIKNIHNNTDCEIKIRINVDKGNINSAFELIEYFASLGLYDIDITLGMLREFGCEHNCKANELLFSMREFSEEFVRFRRHLANLGFKKAVDKMQPVYKINACALDSPNSYVIDPDGFMYKCISQVGNTHLSIGNILDTYDKHSHNRYSPFDSPKCIRCVYFPICKGGCLINTIEKKNEQCDVWKYITEEVIVDIAKEE